MNTKLLEQIVKIKSVYPGEYRLGKFLHAYLVRNGFRVQKQKIANDRYNYFATRGTGRKAVLFYGHLDTVPLTHESEWKTNPFALTRRGDRLYGLGAYDMKAGIAAFLDACIQTSGYVKILLASDEENISEGAWAAVRGRQHFFSDVDLIISAEPNFGMGMNAITTGRTGRFLFTVDCIGKSAHIAKYQKGKDAIQMIATFIDNFYQNRERIFLSRGTFAQIRAVSGESVGMSVCGESTATVEVLPSHKDTLQDIQKRIQSLTTARVRLRPRKTPYLSGYYFAQFPNKPIIGDLISRYTGRDMKLHTRMSVGDDNVLATLGVPVITWGPDGGNAHAPNEYVLASSLQVMNTLFYEYLKMR